MRFINAISPDRMLLVLSSRCPLVYKYRFRMPSISHRWAFAILLRHVDWVFVSFSKSLPWDDISILVILCRMCFIVSPGSQLVRYTFESLLQYHFRTPVHIFYNSSGFQNFCRCPPKRGSSRPRKGDSIISVHLSIRPRPR